MKIHSSDLALQTEKYFHNSLTVINLSEIKYKKIYSYIYWDDVIGNRKGSFQMAFSEDLWGPWIFDLVFFKYPP